jgi:hypothetical protein
MKRKPVERDPLDREIDFSNAIPNPWFVAVHGAKYVRVIDKDLADLFPDNASMNAALRTVAEVAARISPPADAITTKRVNASKATKKK